MRIGSIVQVDETRTEGRTIEERREVTVSTWIAQTDAGDFTFDHEPTADEILAAMVRAAPIPEEAILAEVDAWRSWGAFATEITRRGNGLSIIAQDLAAEAFDRALAGLAALDTERKR